MKSKLSSIFGKGNGKKGINRKGDKPSIYEKIHGITTLAEIKQRREKERKINQLVKEKKYNQALDLVKSHDEAGRDDLQIVFIKALMENNQERKAKEVFDLGFIYPSMEKRAEEILHGRNWKTGLLHSKN